MQSLITLLARLMAQRPAHCKHPHSIAVRARARGRPNRMAASASHPLNAPGGDEETARWTKIWVEEAVPAFDAGGSARALTDLLASSPAAPPLAGARVLVPGAGRVYDAATFVKSGAAEAVALDIVPAAVDAARAWLASPASGLDGGATTAARAVCGDFFALPPDAAPPFDVGYDYTFFCALPPARRPAWAAAWAAALRPGGVLITLCFPMSPPDCPARQGPPWPVSHAAYEAALSPVGFHRTHCARVPDGHSFKSDGHDRNGREWMSVWVLTGGGA